MPKATLAEELGHRWGERVSARRAALSLSQAALAQRCDVSQQTISKIERGLMIPLDPLKVRVALALETDPSTVFAWPTFDSPG